MYLNMDSKQAPQSGAKFEDETEFLALSLENKEISKIYLKFERIF